MRVDLHAHSTYSDGRLTPEEIVRKAARLELSAIAVSDHDNCEGSIVAMRYSKKYGVRVIPAVEISTLYVGRILHLLGYFIDLRNPALNHTLRRLRKDRLSRALKIINKVNIRARKEGMSPVDPGEFLYWIGNKDPIMRGDVARFLFEKGFGKSGNDVFIRWLEPANVPVRGLSTERAIRLIHGAGGVAVLAHPHHESLGLGQFGAVLSRHRKILAHLAKHGLDGCETYIRIRQNRKEAVQYYRRAAKEFNLILTGGSDFHGTDWAPPLGGVRVPSIVLNALEYRRERYAGKS